MNTEPHRIRLPWSRSCFVCGEANPRGLRAELYQVGELIEMAFRPPRELAGWAEVVHGGLVSTVMDELMTWGAIVEERRGYYAAEFAVRFKAPLPPELPCFVRARVTGKRRRIMDVEAWVEDDANMVFARGTGCYLPVPPEQVAAFGHDFVWTEGCLDLRDVFGRAKLEQ